ncbi:pancreatic secretory granule membrane major glycoprotein GP2-like [Pocillopora damicornis]|uniref:pancreatic secretory granule membrane major glycoprotein GP2-like n=1 Tax=Pocillopora damicornis TaxID=46731 RepID=UPI000F55353F|nr:pancreatic secretory granule membrane major glycoprotein GP2-like [Pocillopora damicornis]
MLDYCLSDHRCRTDITGWLNGLHPSLEEGIVNRQACFHWYYNCCYRRVQVQVRRCEGFYVYYLNPSPAGRFRYFAPECLNHKVLSEPDRHISYGRGQKEDSSLIPGWYRFQSYLYEKMLNNCVGHHKCGTDLPGWLNGLHPSIEDGIVDREVCFFGYNKCCYRRVHIRVRKCNGFYVYFLKPSPPGNVRYCAV